jgi:hypothetical protein
MSRTLAILSLAVLCGCGCKTDGGAADVVSVDVDEDTSSGSSAPQTHLGVVVPAGSTVLEAGGKPGYDGASSSTNWIALRVGTKKAGGELATLNPVATALPSGALQVSDERGTTTAEVFAKGADAVPAKINNALPGGTRSVLKLSRQNRPPPCPPCKPGYKTLPGCSCPDIPARRACAADVDCINSCSEGAVNALWLAFKHPKGDGCEDGCASKTMGPPKCVESLCVAFDHKGKHVNDCTKGTQ